MTSPTPPPPHKQPTGTARYPRFGISPESKAAPRKVAVENKFKEQSFSPHFPSNVAGSREHSGRGDVMGAAKSESEAAAVTEVKRVKNIMSDLDLM